MEVDTIQSAESMDVDTNTYKPGKLFIYLFFYTNLFQSAEIMNVDTNTYKPGKLFIYLYKFNSIS